MYKTSEYVSLGHPDKVADFISCYILDKFLEKDNETRYALEVQIKDNFVTLGGEITSNANYSEKEIAFFVKEAVNEIGYTKKYQDFWSKENIICGDEIVVTQHIGMQSPDIAQGVNNNGWGDQGIFWGMAVNNPKTDYMPSDYYLAKKIGQSLYNSRYAGLDIKTQVTMLNNNPVEIVVAIPMLSCHHSEVIENIVKNCCDEYAKGCYQIVINGTGKYEKHGPIGDCGTTGRKLAVDFYGGNCIIGGGSPWTKDYTKADLSLNLLARNNALEYIKAHPEHKEVFCSISCRIGSPEILTVFTDKCGNELNYFKNSISAKEVANLFKLQTPKFSSMCKHGLFA
jgi:S-adenosylmethionine synthetase